MSGFGSGRPGYSYCARCRKRIEIEDLDNGGAAVSDNRIFCPDCRGDLPDCAATGRRKSPDKAAKVPAALALGKNPCVEPARPEVKTPRSNNPRPRVPAMILAGVAIMAVGALALCAFIVFSMTGVRHQASTDRIDRKSEGAATDSAVDRQREIDERIHARLKDVEDKTGGPTKLEVEAPSQAPEKTPAGDQSEPLAAADTESIRASAGKTATVSGRVSSCSWSGTGKVLFVNFSGDRGGFYAVMFKNREKEFQDAFGAPPEKHLAGRAVEITGRIDLFEGRPQIKLENPGQVRFRD